MLSSSFFHATVLSERNGAQTLYSSLAPYSRSYLVAVLTNIKSWNNSPARFYVSVVMKMILSHLIVEYEFKLADPTARPFMTFCKTRLPSPFMSILVRKRKMNRDGKSS